MRILPEGTPPPSVPPNKRGFLFPQNPTISKIGNKKTGKGSLRDPLKDPHMDYLKEFLKDLLKDSLKDSLEDPL